METAAQVTLIPRWLCVGGQNELIARIHTSHWSCSTTTSCVVLHFYREFSSHFDRSLQWRGRNNNSHFVDCAPLLWWAPPSRRLFSKMYAITITCVQVTHCRRLGSCSQKVYEKCFVGAENCLQGSGHHDDRQQAPKIGDERKRKAFSGIKYLLLLLLVVGGLSNFSIHYLPSVSAPLPLY